MGFKNQAGIGVSNYYGARDTGGSAGIETGDGSEFILSVSLTGASINDGFVPPVTLPKGALLKGATLRVDEAFSLGGTSPTVQVGLNGSVATNNVTLSKTELEAIGTKTPASTGNGTLAVGSATGVAAATKLAIALGGNSPTVSATVGKATLLLKLVNKTKV